MTANSRASVRELRELAHLYCRPTTAPPELPKEQRASDLIATLDYHGITQLAHYHNALPDSLGKVLSSRRAMMAANELMKRRVLQELFAGFKEAGLDQIILFKGTALAYSHYPEPWLRPRSDVDCIIDRRQYEAFVAVFQKLGYTKLFSIDGEHVHYQATYSKALARNVAINVDLHWRISNRKLLSRSYSVKRLLRDSVPAAQLGDFVRAPCAVDNLLIAALHRLGHHPHEERLIWLYDVHLLAQSLRSEDWAALEKKTAHKKLVGLTLDALSLCESVFDTALPESVMERLRRAAKRPEPSQLFLQRDLSEWRIFWRDLQGLPNFPTRARAIWQNLFPPGAYVREHMQTQWTLWAHCKRLWRGFRRFRQS